MLEYADFAAALGQKRQAHDVEQERRGQQRIAALPEELQDHLRIQKSLEMDMIPRRLPVIERFDVFDRHMGLRLVADDGADDLVLGLNLRRLVGGIVEHHAVAVAEDVVANPAQDLEIAISEHRCQYGLHQSFAGFAVLAANRRLAFLGKFQGRREGRAERRREVDVGDAEIEGCPGVQGAGWDRGILRIEGGAEFRAATVALVQFLGRLRRGDVGDYQLIELVLVMKFAQVGLHAIDRLLRRADAFYLRQIGKFAYRRP